MQNHRDDLAINAYSDRQRINRITTYSCGTGDTEKECIIQGAILLWKTPYEALVIRDNTLHMLQTRLINQGYALKVNFLFPTLKLFSAATNGCILESKNNRPNLLALGAAALFCSSIGWIVDSTRFRALHSFEYSFALRNSAKYNSVAQDGPYVAK